MTALTCKIIAIYWRIYKSSRTQTYTQQVKIVSCCTG